MHRNPRTARSAFPRFAQGLAWGALCALALAVSGPVAAQTRGLDPAKPGVAVYPGAKHDAATSEFLRTSLQVDGAAYRTADDVAKVAAFYKGQAGVQAMGDAAKDSAAFSAGCKEEFNAALKKKITTGCALQITVQRPWMDMKTGKMMPDTLVSIVKQP